jgi:signal transduction histidine kinase
VDLVKSIFAAARNTAGAYDLNVVVTELVENIEGANMLPANIKLEQRLDRSGTTLVAGDSMEMSRVLLNLCLNARDAMEKGGGVLTITTRGADNSGRAMIQVMDTGVGMSAEQLKKIWQPHVSEDRRHGYGLTIVKQKLDDVQGSIAVESAPGRGTTFSIGLKIAAATP